MKTIIFLLLLLPATISDEPAISDDCKCKGILLFGKVRVVNALADFDVRITDAFEDLRVDSTACCPSECGEWEFVDALEDFSIRYVDAFEDFSVRYIDAFAGLP